MKKGVYFFSSFFLSLFQVFILWHGKMSSNYISGTEWRAQQQGKAKTKNQHSHPAPHPAPRQEGHECVNFATCAKMATNGPLCRECFIQSAKKCRVCNQNLTTFKNGVCKQCFQSKEHQCQKCSVTIKVPGYCKECYIPLQPCVVCHENPTRHKVCKECAEKKVFDCAKCHEVKVSFEGFSCEGCFPPATECKNCHQNSTRNTSGICKACYEFKQFQCEDCGTNIEKPSRCKPCFNINRGYYRCVNESCDNYIPDKDSFCYVCRKSAGFKCSYCHTEKVPTKDMECGLCIRFQRQPLHDKKQPCAYSWTEHGQKFYCKNETSHGKYCYGCYCCF